MSSINNSNTQIDVVPLSEGAVSGLEIAIDGQAQEVVVTEAHSEAPPAEETVLASLGLNPQLFAIQLLNFAIVVAILWFLIFKPLSAKMEERTKLIDSGLKNADKAKQDLLKSEEQSEGIITAANKKANTIVFESKEQAEKNMEQLLHQARQEADKVIAKGKEDVKVERESMLTEVKEDVIEMVMNTSKKVLGKSTSPQVDEAWVKDQLDS